MNNNNDFLHAKSRQELAKEYNISVRTFSRWLKKNSIIIPKGLVTPVNIRKIYQVLGTPHLTK